MGLFAAKGPIAVIREAYQTGKALQGSIEKTSGPEGDRRVGVTAVAGCVIVGLAAGAALGVSRVDFNKPNPRETAYVPAEVCQQYQEHALDILAQLAMDSRLVLGVAPSSEGGLMLNATVSEWGTRGMLTFQNRDMGIDPALTSPDLAIRGEAIDRFIQAPGASFAALNFDGNKALSGAGVVAGERVTGEYYADGEPIEVGIVGIHHPDNSVSTECKISSISKSVRESGRAEALPVQEAAKVGLAVITELLPREAQRYI